MQYALNLLKEYLKKTFLLTIVNKYRRRKEFRLRAQRETAAVTKWISEGKPLPPPHSYKAITIKDYAKKYRTPVLIETGTYLGDSIKSCLESFKKLITIELDDALYQRAVNLFVLEKHVTIYKGDSGVLLKEIINKIDKPTLFWLDGHYSEGITAKGILNTPIIAELHTILSHPIKKHVILIDDARDFKGQNDYPTIQGLKDLVYASNPNLKFYVENDIVRIHP